MATTVISLDLTVTGADQAAANTKARNLARDAVKQNLAAINARLAARTPPERPITEADVDALGLPGASRLLRVAVRGFVQESARAWRVTDADVRLVQPVRGAPDDVDEVA